MPVGSLKRYIVKHHTARRNSMGNTQASASSESDNDDNLKTDIQPLPVYSDNCWLCTCRPEGTLVSFSEAMYLMQPNLAPLCRWGAKCHNQHHRDHAEQFQHPRAPCEEDTPFQGRACVDISAWREDHASPPLLASWMAPAMSRESVEGATEQLQRDVQFREAASAGVPLDLAPAQEAAPPTTAPAEADADAQQHRQKQIPTNRTVLVYVHGFRQPYAKVHNALRCLASLDEGNVCVVAFTWPAHRNKAAYWRAKAKVPDAADRLRQLLSLLLAHNNAVHVMGHSMGARVCLHALSGWDERRMGHCFLIAAAVAADALTKDGEFPASQLSCTGVTVFHSENDTILPKGFVAGEIWGGLWDQRPVAAVTAMGLHGALGEVKSDAEALTSDVESVDVSEEVKYHYAPVWLQCKTVRERVSKKMGVKDMA